MVTMFYWIWSVIGILIVLTIVTLLILSVSIGTKFYKLTLLIYQEQQELIEKIRKAVDEPKVPEVKNEDEGSTHEQSPEEPEEKEPDAE